MSILKHYHYQTNSLAKITIIL